MTDIPLFPLSNALFPAGLLQLRVFEVRYLDLVRQCQADGTPFGVVALLAGQEVRTPEGIEVLAPVGTYARIDRCDALTPTLWSLTCTGLGRFQLGDTQRGKFGLWRGQAQDIPDDPIVQLPAAHQDLADLLGRAIAQAQREGAPELPIAPPYRLDEAGWVADRWCELLPLSPAVKARLLASTDALARLRELRAWLRDNGLP
ncbi:MAG: LON peptidase substrate-binding domain-containing protein [Bordetella sp.]|nr:LON peptidase substrate-binding domain-containing protein [Bordetella sp.]